MRKMELLDAIKKLIRQQARATPTRELWSTKCKLLEEKCPMSTTLLGEDWCDVSQENTIYTKDYKMCFEYRELLRVIHEGFVAMDTSYEIPQLRLKLPRDAVRQFIPKKVVKKILLNPAGFEENIDYMINNQELFYFFLYLDDFYKTFDKPQYTVSNVNPVQLSQEIEKWFRKFKTPAGGLKLLRFNGGDEIEWEFVRKNEIKSYTLSGTGKLRIYNKPFNDR